MQPEDKEALVGYMIGVIFMALYLLFESTAPWPVVIIGALAWPLVLMGYASQAHPNTMTYDMIYD